MRDIHVSQVAGNRRLPGQPLKPLSAIVAALIASGLALFLCFLATVFGVGDDGGWLVLPPDYTELGWIARTLGGVLGVVAFISLVFIHQQLRQRGRRHRRSYASTLVQAGLGISIACIVWEIALLALVVLLVLGLAYGLFADSGF